MGQTIKAVREEREALKRHVKTLERELQWYKEEFTKQSVECLEMREELKRHRLECPMDPCFMCRMEHMARVDDVLCDIP